MKLLTILQLFLALFFIVIGGSVSPAQETALPLHMQVRRAVADAEGAFAVEAKQTTWNPAETAIVVCDMWDQHWCKGATARVAEMVPTMNEVLEAARSLGILVIHCPSDTMKFYEGFSQRKLAQAAPTIALKPLPSGWCPLASGQEPQLPFVNPHDRCDCESQCAHGNPWRRQIASLQIADQDAITDNAEALYLMRARGIRNVIVMGVHSNMCVLGRPFSIRQLAAQGLNVVLMRDLTDSMHDSQQPPLKLDHFRANDMVVEHIEKYWCPTILSSDLTGKAPFSFAADRRPRVVFVIGEDEYETARTLPEFAEAELASRGLRSMFVHSTANDQNDFSGLEALDTADLMVVSVRRRTLLKEQLDRIKRYVASGRPVVGIRTASHAFALRDGAPPPAGYEAWPEFDAQVLGGNYHGHHDNPGVTGPKTSVWIDPLAKAHPILIGITAGELQTSGSLYKTSPVAKTATPLVMGRVEGRELQEPVAWTNDVGKSRIFYTSLGHPGDFQQPFFRRLLLNGILWALDWPTAVAELPLQSDAGTRPTATALASSQSDLGKTDEWAVLEVPNVWESNTRFVGHDGFAWYRCAVKLRPEWNNQDVELEVDKIDNAHEAYVNGEKVGSSGQFPPSFQNGTQGSSRYSIPAKLFRPGEENIVALRAFDAGGRGGFKGMAPVLWLGEQGMPLEGKWEFHTGDDLAWSTGHSNGIDAYTYVMSKESLLAQARRFDDNNPPYSPQRSASMFEVPGDLELTQVLAEPIVAQPLSISFDERGRMWVVQYLQYPHPAGLKMLSRDNVWRAVYDKVPPPPPHHFRGADKITIHEDADGNGLYETHKTFIEGLNIATSCARGRGGVWVLNPPYLLFYPDRNNDDVPDGDPEVHLSGFGLEDTHSVANSLCWGPDGWLYAAQGSTVSGDVIRPGLDKQPVHSLGQLIWRYHPETRRYEIFAEGGGNAFGCEIDAKGRVFSGHNGGDTRGFHYVQGGYSQKGFGKHGPLSNPYAFGYFPAMKHPAVPRFTHCFTIYEGGTLPAAHEGKLFAVAPLLNHVVESDIWPDGSSFQTKDIGYPVTSADSWFKPVHITIGPDGALYIADWYDGQVNHYRNHEGQIDTKSGRIYRLAAKGSPPAKQPDLSHFTTPELVERLKHPNRWQRFTALRLLGDRHDMTAVAALRKMLSESPGADALEILWALNLCGGFDEATLLAASAHTDPYVRLWAIRLACDERQVSSAVARRMVEMARDEPNVESRSQLACSARRLPAADGLPVIAALLAHDEDASDVHLPLLLWWGIEVHADRDREAILKMFSNAPIWSLPLVEQHLLPRLMRRYAQAGTRRDLLTCAQLLRQSPSPAATSRLMAGFEEAFSGRPLAGLPDELIEAVAQAGGGSLALQVRRGDAQAVDLALAKLTDEKAQRAERLQFAKIFGEFEQPKSVDVLLKVARSSADQEVQMAALAALQRYDDPAIGQAVVEMHSTLPDDARAVAQTLLSSRQTWSLALLSAVDGGQIDSRVVPLPIVRKMLLKPNEQIATLVGKHWGSVQGQTTAEMRATIERLSSVIRSNAGNPYEGKKLFMANCGKCHALFEEGGKIGPDLTSYKRDDLETMLLNIVNPSAEVREGFENYLVVTTDGRALNGFLADQDNQVVVLRGADGQSLTIPREDIEEMRVVPLSIMPEGVLKDCNDQQVCDLFAYLRSTQPQVRHDRPRQDIERRLASERIAANAR